MFSWIPNSTFRSADQEIALDRMELLLTAGEIDLADEHYERACRKHLSEAEYADRREVAAADLLKRQRVEAARKVAAEREELKGTVRRALQEGEFEEADRLYSGDCAAWWPDDEYQNERCDAWRTWMLLERYAAASIAELDGIYAEHLSGVLPGDDFARIKLRKLKIRIARLGMPLSHEQLLACARPERNRMIRARAGSGKTRTLAALSALAIHDEQLDSNQVLILAFNKKAATEIGDRVRVAAGVDGFCNARTFHSLAYQLANIEGRSLLFDDGDLQPSRRKQSAFMERLVGSLMNPAFRNRIYEFFRQELEQLDRLGAGLSPDEYVTFRRSMVDYTLQGETVKSKGEKFIADFLFEHGIAYEYEKVWSWDRADHLRGSPYRPDFSVFCDGRDLVVEHWAIDPDDPTARLPDWWETKTADYRDQIEAKRRFWKARGVVLVETHAGQIGRDRGAFENSLRDLLQRNGLACRKLPHEELVRRVVEGPRTVSRMSELFLSFISRAKKRGWGVEEVARAARELQEREPRNRIFHELAVRAYAVYEERLVEQAALDFDDLLGSAIDSIRREKGASRLHLGKGGAIAIRELRWIMIDEFQDFSQLYFELISAIIEVNPAVRVVAVGDDWQAINGFAGAQPKFFQQFEDYFPGSGQASISTNRRSGRAIVAAGNRIMLGRGKPAQAHHGFSGDINIRAIDKIWTAADSVSVRCATSVNKYGRKETNWELAKALQLCADYIAESVVIDEASGVRRIPSVLVLARTGRAYGARLEAFRRGLAGVLCEHPDLGDLAEQFVVGHAASSSNGGAAVIEVLTAHRSKGKEAEVVIVLEATDRQFPKVHADNQLFGIFGSGPEDALAEERRLFYVAMTRAMHRVLFVTETGGSSPYLLEMMRAPASDEPVMDGADADLCSDFGWILGERLKAVDPMELIRRNVSAESLICLDQLDACKDVLPEVGFEEEGMHAELAWPELQPPLAVLIGRHRESAPAWRALGWRVACG